MKIWKVKIKDEEGRRFEGRFHTLTPVEAIFKLTYRDGLNHGDLETVSVKKESSG